MKAIDKKTNLLAKAQRDIQTNLAKGDRTKDALQKAIGKLPITPEEKNVIKQQVAASLQEGIPPVYAVQQAIQSLPAVSSKRKGGRPKKGGMSVSELIDSGVI
jgi:hypothetical protein